MNIDDLRYNLWYYVTRHLTVDAVCWKLAWLLPRKVALYAFVRVYSVTGTAPGDDYCTCYNAWEAGEGR